MAGIFKCSSRISFLGHMFDVLHTTKLNSFLSVSQLVPDFTILQIISSKSYLSRKVYSNINL